MDKALCEVIFKKNGTHPKISVIIPVYNGAVYVKRCLDSLFASDFKDFEVIIVDDGSTDNSLDIALSLAEKHYQLVIIKHDSNYGNEIARNTGADNSSAEILVFIDMDICVRNNTLSKIYDHFYYGSQRCVIGLYSLDHPNKNFCSLYKNSWIRFSYLIAPDNVDWFFTAIGAINREDWLKYGPFPHAFSVRSGGADIGFGKYIHNRGVNILLDKTLDVVHLKRFNLIKLLRNDLLRASGYTRLGVSSVFAIWKKHPEIFFERFANIYQSFLISVIIVWCLVVVVPLIWLSGYFSLLFPLTLILIYICLNYSFYLYFTRNFGIVKSLLVYPMMFLDHFISGFGVICGIAIHIIRRFKRKNPRN